LPEPITLVVGGRPFRTHLQSRSGYPYIWVCPDMENDAGRLVRLAHVLRDFGLVRNQRITLGVSGRQLTIQGC
jgi:hypothetical protein